jgi:hypothetical protein
MIHNCIIELVFVAMVSNHATCKFSLSKFGMFDHKFRVSRRYYNLSLIGHRSNFLNYKLIHVKLLGRLRNGHIYKHSNSNGLCYNFHIYCKYLNLKKTFRCDVVGGKDLNLIFFEVFILLSVNL